jgi:hypothetical protein
VLARVDAVYPEPVERAMERHERSAFSSPFAGKPVRAAFDGGRLTSDAGVLVLAEIEHQLKIAEAQPI